MSLLNKAGGKNVPASNAKAGLPRFSLDLLQKLLFMVIVFSSAYAAISAAGKADYFSRQDIFKISSPSSSPQDFSLKKQKDYASFVESLKKKQFFSSPCIIEEKKDVSSLDREKLSKVIENLRLTGVLSTAPAKVVIEDKKTGKSFYLKEGESFLDDIKVEKITNGSVLLKYHGENFELYF